MSQFKDLKRLDTEMLVSICGQLLNGVSARKIAQQLHQLGHFPDASEEALAKQLARFKHAIMNRPEFHKERKAAILDVRHQLTLLFWHQRQRVDRGLMLEHVTGKLDSGLGKEIKLTGDILARIAELDRVDYPKQMSDFKLDELKEMQLSKDGQYVHPIQQMMRQIAIDADKDVEEYLKEHPPSNMH